MIKELLLDSWHFFRNHLTVLSLIVLPILVPVEIFTAIAEQYVLSEKPTLQELFTLRIASILAYPVYSVAVVYYIAAVIQDKTLNVQAAWQLGIRYWLPYLTLSLLMGILIVFGLMLFIVPGIILLVRLAFAQFDLLLNGSNPIDAIKNSWNQTREYMFVLLAGYLVLAILLYAPYYMYAVSTRDSGLSLDVLDTIIVIVYGVLEFLFTVYAFRIYDLARKQNFKGNKPAGF